ncbi:efflux RND transporter periplasmic adaptor subunit [Bacillus xiapuensis]|uniref:efflux RND transporter periplasmic adaptor subunit n=1 Tax=Bacillus xiapuensis TaxID=2014075 RepID=UPI0012FDEC25|nr:hypothetical protein [Bacillus xiapuensis]
MKRLNRNMLLAASAAFIAGNLYLTYKEDSKVERTQPITSWKTASNQDVVESFRTTGVITPAEEYPVYFNKEQGTFQKFLVKEGQPVSPGTPLFEYSSSDLEQKVMELEAEKSKTQQQIQLMNKQISQLQSILSELEREDSKDAKDKKEERNKDARVTTENEIIDQETEKFKLEEELRKYDKLIAEYESSKSNLIVKSEVEGFVKSIDQNLNNPLISIRSRNPAIQGVFDEKQMKKVTEGLKIHAAVDPFPPAFNGSITDIHEFPEEEPSVKRKSLYPFTAQLEQNGFEEELSQLLPGMKANVTVVTKEALQAVTVPKSSVETSGKRSYVYVLNTKGDIEKRSVTPGLLVKDVQEIQSGLAAGEKIVTNPDKLLAEHASFITPIQQEKLAKKDLQQLSKKEKIKFILMGVLS